MRPDLADRRLHRVRSGARAQSAPLYGAGTAHVLGAVMTIGGLLLIWALLVTM